ncbi:hypothetical protein PV797_05265 [Clostridiaceae bacterium M8S5]|nr:hypothetical protein PV797_05265 [Clostridiaceae bacterium M8S5]
MDKETKKIKSRDTLLALYVFVTVSLSIIVLSFRFINKGILKK